MAKKKKQEYKKTILAYNKKLVNTFIYLIFFSTLLLVP